VGLRCHLRVLADTPPCILAAGRSATGAAGSRVQFHRDSLAAPRLVHLQHRIPASGAVQKPPQKARTGAQAACKVTETGLHGTRDDVRRYTRVMLGAVVEHSHPAIILDVHHPGS